MDVKILPKVSRADAVEVIGKEYGLRPFFAIALAHRPYREVLELVERAVARYPHDDEARGLYVRKHAQEL